MAASSDPSAHTPANISSPMQPAKAITALMITYTFGIRCKSYGLDGMHRFMHGHSDRGDIQTPLGFGDIHPSGGDIHSFAVMRCTALL